MEGAFVKKDQQSIATSLRQKKKGRNQGLNGGTGNKKGSLQKTETGNPVNKKSPIWGEHPNALSSHTQREDKRIFYKEERFPLCVNSGLNSRQYARGKDP